MTWPLLLAIAAALVAAFSAGLAVGLLRTRARMRRVSEGIAELAAGNLAHRIILPGGDEAACMAEDVNRLADAIQVEREAASSCDASRRLLLANVSHDLRTPITSIAGYVDALQRGLGDEPDRYLAVIGAKADELAQLTDDLFYEARLDAGDLTLKRSRLDLAEAVRRSVLGFEPQLVGMGVRVDVDIPEDPCFVEADPSAVTRILSNLVANGVRHGEGMTAFSVAMLSLDADHVVRVGNDGPRLPEDASHLFERGATGTGGGAGLGLSIARELAERMGATVVAENTSEGGVAFTLTFPKAPRSEFSGS
ncbi:MAG: HAMP domain-containing sensor histidine kinase [Coriobacteriia bacterium]